MTDHDHLVRLSSIQSVIFAKLFKIPLLRKEDGEKDKYKKHGYLQRDAENMNSTHQHPSCLSEDHSPLAATQEMSEMSSLLGKHPLHQVSYKL